MAKDDEGRKGKKDKRKIEPLLWGKRNSNL